MDFRGLLVRRGGEGKGKECERGNREGEEKGRERGGKVKT